MVKKTVQANAYNIAEEFNNVQRIIIGDGLISKPSIYITASQIIITPFKFVHKGIICEVQDVIYLTKPSFTKYYIYVDVVNSLNDSGVKFYLLENESDAYVLLGTVDNDNIIYPETVTFKSSKQLVQLQFGNNLKGKVFYDPATAKVSFDNVVHTFGMESKYIDYAETVIPSFVVTGDKKSILLLKPDLDFIPWGSVGTSFTAANVITDYAQSISFIPITKPNFSNNSTLAVYRENSGNNYTKVLMLDSDANVVTSAVSTFATSSVAFATAKVEKSAIGVEAVVLRVDSSGNLVLETISFSAPATLSINTYSFTESVATYSKFKLIPDPTSDDILYIAAIDTAAKNLKVWKVANYNAIITSTTIPLDTANDYTNAKIEADILNNLTIAIYDSTFETIEYKIETASLTILDTYKSTPPTSYFKMRFVDSRLVRVYISTDTAGNTILNYFDETVSRNYNLGTNVDYMHGYFVYDYFHVVVHYTTGDVRSVYISRKSDYEYDRYNTTSSVEEASIIHSGFHAIAEANGAVVNLRLVPDNKSFIPSDSAALGVAYITAGDIKFVAAKFGSVFSQGQQAVSISKKSVLDIETLYQDFIDYQTKSTPYIQINGEVEIPAKTLPPCVIEGGTLNLVDGELRGDGTLISANYTLAGNTITLTTGAIYDYGIAVGTVLSDGINTARVVSIKSLTEFDVDNPAITGDLYIRNNVEIRNSHIKGLTSSTIHGLFSNVKLKHCYIDVGYFDLSENILIEDCEVYASLYVNNATSKAFLTRSYISQLVVNVFNKLIVVDCDIDIVDTTGYNPAYSVGKERIIWKRNAVVSISGTYNLFKESDVALIGDGKKSFGDYNIETLEELNTLGINGKKLLFLSGKYRASNTAGAVVNIDANNGIFWEALSDDVVIDTNHCTIKFLIDNPAEDVRIDIRKFYFLDYNTSSLFATDQYDPINDLFMVKVDVANNTNNKKIKFVVKDCVFGGAYKGAYVRYPHAIGYNENIGTSFEQYAEITGCIFNTYEHSISCTVLGKIELQIKNNYFYVHQVRDTVYITSVLVSGIYFYGGASTTARLFISDNICNMFVDGLGAELPAGYNMSFVNARPVNEIKVTNNRFESEFVNFTNPTVAGSYFNTLLYSSLSSNSFDGTYAPTVHMYRNHIRVKYPSGFQFSSYFGCIFYIAADPTYVSSTHIRVSCNDIIVQRPVITASANKFGDVIYTAGFATQATAPVIEFYSINCSENLQFYIRTPSTGDTSTPPLTIVEYNVLNTGDIVFAGNIERRPKGILHSEATKTTYTRTGYIEIGLENLKYRFGGDKGILIPVDIEVVDWNISIPASASVENPPPNPYVYGGRVPNASTIFIDHLTLKIYGGSLTNLTAVNFVISAFGLDSASNPVSYTKIVPMISQSESLYYLNQETISMATWGIQDLIYLTFKLRFDNGASTTVINDLKTTGIVVLW